MKQLVKSISSQRFIEDQLWYQLIIQIWEKIDNQSMHNLMVHIGLWDQVRRQPLNKLRKHLKSAGL